MGYMAHDAAIAVVPSWREDIVTELDKFRRRLATEHPEIRPFFVGPITTVNQDNVYAFLPDGSKEGWGLSETAEEWREQFVEIARGSLTNDDDPDQESYWDGGDVVHSRFGGDYGAEVGTQLVFTTDTKEPVVLSR